jgi:hypothetical protein
VVMAGGAGLKLLGTRMHATIERSGAHDAFAPQARALGTALQALQAATRAAWSSGSPDDALINAMPYMQAFGHTVLAWIWLELASAAQAVREPSRADAMAGRLQAMRYFFAYELPKVPAWLEVVSARDPVCRDMRDAWF